MTLQPPLPGYQALRRGRWSGPGQVYLVTTVTHQRQRLFLDWTSASLACSIFSDARNWADARLLCWVLMPDHWHGLVELGSLESLADLLGRVKGKSARAINLAAGRTGPVWMPGFHDRALRHEQSVVKAARYLVANPLRAALVDRLGDYPYWDSIWLSAEDADVRSERRG